MHFVLSRCVTRCFLLAALALAGCPSNGDDNPPGNAGPDDDEDASADEAPDDDDAQVAVRDAEADAQSGADGGAGAHDAGPCTVTAPTDCPDPPTRYGAVQPIIEARCESCHDGLHDQWPLTTYQHVTDWFNEIRAQMLSCTMPPLDSGIAMPDSERETLLRWIRCDYPQ